MRTVQQNVISPVDALWTLYKSQPKKVRMEFLKRVKGEDNEDEAFEKYVKSKRFAAQRQKVEQEHLDGKSVVCKTPEEIVAHLNSL